MLSCASYVLFITFDARDEINDIRGGACCGVTDYVDGVKCGVA